MSVQNLKRIRPKTLDVKTWLKYKKLGLGKRVKVKTHPYPEARQFNFYKGAESQYGTIIALYFEHNTKVPDAYGIALDKPIFNGGDLSVIPVFEKFIIRLTTCEFGHGVWMSGDRFNFL